MEDNDGTTKKKTTEGGSLKDLISNALPEGAMLTKVSIKVTPTTPQELAEIRKRVEAKHAAKAQK